MVRAIKQHVSVQHISDPAGGMFCWATLSSESANTTSMLPEAGKAGVAYVPGEHFYSTPTDRRSMRLSYVTNAPDVIEEGVCRLATIFG
jgi:2-aminoadipate transaminase